MQMVGPAYMDYAINGRVGGPDRQQAPAGGRGAPRGLPMRRGRPLDQHRGADR